MPQQVRHDNYTGLSKKGGAVPKRSAARKKKKNGENLLHGDKLAVFRICAFQLHHI